MDVSVVICAYTLDRFDDLVAAVASVQAQTLPPRDVIVVIDHSPDLLERAAEAFPGACVVPNRHAQGLSGARNTGVEKASGDVVAFLDDDALAEPSWLERLTEPYGDPAVIGVGGHIEALWPDGRPHAFPAEFDWVVGCSYAGLPQQRAEVRNMIGANMSLRRDVLAQVGGFSSSLGRIGAIPMGCEETELCIRARRERPEGRVVHEPAARVRHRVAPARTGWRYFRARCWAEGLSKAGVAELAGTEMGLASERAHALRVLPAGILRGLRDAVRGDAHGLLRAGAIACGLLVTAAGYLWGTVRR